MKIRIINQEYMNDPHAAGRLMFWEHVERPWLVMRPAKPKHFPTHAEAIRYADEMATALREVAK